MMHDLAPEPQPAARPRLRGVLHQWACLGSVVAGIVLLVLAPTKRAFAAAAIYGASLTALLLTSALYHRVTWSVAARRWMGRLDHSMIAVLIAGTFTPFAMVVLPGPLARTLLVAVWSGAVAVIVLHLVWYEAPKALSAVLYVLLGWVGVVAMPHLVASTGWVVVGLLLAGGILYSIGALVYGLRRPDPFPATFGYHEVFHALVVLAATAHYGAVAITILPA